MKNDIVGNERIVQYIPLVGQLLKSLEEPGILKSMFGMIYMM